MITALLATSFGPTYNLPHAAEMDNGFQYSIGTGVAALRAGPLPSVRATGGFTKNKTTVQMSSTSYFGQNVEGFDIIGIRRQVLVTDKWRVAPFGMVVDYRGASDQDYRVTTRLGVAFERGAGRFRWDGSVSLLGLQSFPFVEAQRLAKMTQLDTMLASESGLSLQVNEQHWVRMGLLGPIPTISHMWQGERMVLRTTGGTLGTQHYFQVDMYPLLGKQ